MEHEAFYIGLEFWCSDRRWRCTDVGSRTIVAIRVDRVEAALFHQGAVTIRSLDQEAAEAEAWFSGPPYAVAESVFDEDDLLGCSLQPE